MKIRGVDFASYGVSDLKKAADFYKNVLGLKLSAQGEGWAEFDAGNLAVDLIEGKGGSSGGIALAVDDVKKSLDELKKKGVKIEGEMWETPVCFGATIKDPDDNTIHLHHRKDGKAGAE